MAETNNDNANSSSLPRGGYINANVIPDNPLSVKYFMVGAIPVPWHKKKKKNSLLEMGQRNRNSSSECSFCSTINDNNSSNISPTKTLSVTKKFTSHGNESPHGSHSWKKDNTASDDRRFNKRQRKFNYDICFCGKRNSTPLEKNEKNSIEFEMQEEGTNEGILRPGMVLLKHHLTHNEQVEIVKSCRNLGLGPGGFYQPGSVRLHLDSIDISSYVG
ncbi:hypothetical protein RYX36_012331 [Vicia faba]